MERNKYQIGLDGGGTGTQVCVRCPSCEKEELFVLGPLNLNGQTKEKTRQTLRQTRIESETVLYSIPLGFTLPQIDRE